MNIEEPNDLVLQKEAYILTGIVHPARADVNIPKVKCALAGMFINISGKLEFSCTKSLITATFVTDSKIENINELRNIIRNAVSIRVHYLGFILGCGYDVEIDRMIFPNGDVTVFGVDFPALRDHVQHSPLNLLKIENITGGISSPTVSLILSDFNIALRDPDNLPFYCYRCIEAAMQFFKKDGMSEKAGWELMHSQLNTERKRDGIDYIKNFSDSLRHGRLTNRTDQEGVEIVNKTWDILLKFFQFLSVNNNGKILQDPSS